MNQLKLVSNNSEIAEEKDIKKQRIQNTWATVGWGLKIGIGVIFVSTYASNHETFSSSTYLLSILYRAGFGLLLGGACFCGGGLLGFIFGIPSFSQLPDSRLKYNDNLMQISDWLTKIIVGVGLTQLYNIPKAVMSLGEYLKFNLGNDPSARNASLALFFYWLILGFLAIYFWTKTDYTLIMKSTDDDVQKQLAGVKQELAGAKQEKESAISEAAAAVKDKEKAEALQNISEAEVKSFTTNPETQQFAQQIVERLKESVVGKQGLNIEDPQKNKWGGKSESNGRELSAIVKENALSDELFSVALKVESTDSTKPLVGDVQFHLHPTFHEQAPVVPVENGVASLLLTAWGAFTVGAVCLSDNTQLELDLALLPNAPELFKSR